MQIANFLINLINNLLRHEKNNRDSELPVFNDQERISCCLEIDLRVRCTLKDNLKARCQLSPQKYI